MFEDPSFFVGAPEPISISEETRPFVARAKKGSTLWQTCQWCKRTVVQLQYPSTCTRECAVSYARSEFDDQTYDLMVAVTIQYGAKPPKCIEKPREDESSAEFWQKILSEIYDPNDPRLAYLRADLDDQEVASERSVKFSTAAKAVQKTAFLF